MQGDSLPAQAGDSSQTAVPFTPPDNGGYATAGYLVVGVVYLAYAVSLVRRMLAERR